MCSDAVPGQRDLICTACGGRYVNIDARTARRQKSMRRLIPLLVLVNSLSACGLKGPLYLPQQKPAAKPPASGASAPETQAPDAPGPDRPAESKKSPAQQPQ